MCAGVSVSDRRIETVNSETKSKQGTVTMLSVDLDTALNRVGRGVLQRCAAGHERAQVDVRGSEGAQGARLAAAQAVGLEAFRQGEKERQCRHETAHDKREAHHNAHAVAQDVLAALHEAIRSGAGAAGRRQ